MGRKWKLRDTEWDALDHLRFGTTDAEVFRNATLILMTAVGRSKNSIADDLGCSPGTVDNVRKRYRDRGLEGLKRRKPPGPRAKATGEYRAALREAIQTPPQTLGFGFSVWSAAQLGGVLGTEDRHPFDGRSRAAHPARGGFFLPAAKAYDERQAGRSRLPKIATAVETHEKRAIEGDSNAVLIYQDEMEIHLHPALTRMWAPVARQPEVPAPGKNQKKVIYGGVDYKTGKLTYTVADTKCGTSFLVFLVALLAAYVGKKICLVCDNGRFHTTKAVTAWLDAHRDQVEVYWLPSYCPSLNLIERLWGHLKRTVLANVLYAGLPDLVAAFRKGVRRLTGNRDHMGFMFDHDDVTQELRSKGRKAAA